MRPEPVGAWREGQSLLKSVRNADAYVDRSGSSPIPAATSELRSFLAGDHVWPGQTTMVDLVARRLAAWDAGATMIVSRSRNNRHYDVIVVVDARDY